MRRPPSRSARTALPLVAAASLLLAAGCSSSGRVADINVRAGDPDSVAGSLFDPSAIQKLAPGAGRQGHDGGLGSTPTLPSFDAAPLPQTVRAQRVQPPYTSGTQAITGKLFFFRKGQENSGNYYVCSGTVIQSRNRSLVWTAGHCVHDGKGGDWHTDMVFVPAFDDSAGDTDVDPTDLGPYAPLGVFPIRHAWTSQQWIDTGDDHGGDLAHDYAVLEVGRDARGQTLDDAIAAAGPAAGQPAPMWFNAPTISKVSIFGYPAAAPYDGMTQYGCQVNALQLLNLTELGPTAKEYRAGCDLTGGASGGGWFAQAPGQAAGQVSLVTNTSVGSAHGEARSWLAGPYLDSEAQALYNTANAAAAP